MKNIGSAYKENYNRDYHTTVRLIDDKYVINPNFTKGSSLGSFFYPNPIELVNEIIIDVSQNENEKKKEWLTVELENGVDENSGLVVNKESAEQFLFENYQSVIENFINDMEEANDMDEETMLREHSNIPSHWRDFDKFKEKINSTEYPILYLYQNLPNRDPTRYDFQLIHINLP